MPRAERLIPNRLRKYRLMHGYEQTHVAYLLGLKSHARISEWERGISMPNVSNLLKLSAVYRTLPDELYYDLRLELIKDINTREQWLEAKKDVGG